MIRDFKEVFEGFLKDRMDDTNDCMLVENTIFCKQDEVITSFLDKLKKEDPKQGEILDMAICYVRYTITASLYGVLASKRGNYTLRRFKTQSNVFSIL
jgi:hypothetical protein